MNSAGLTKRHAQQKAQGFVGLLSVIAIGTMFRESSYNPSLVWLYALLLLNTYYSIAFFSQLIPTHLQSQRIIDGALSVCYILLPFFFDQSVVYIQLMAVLFILAALKYAVVIDATSYNSVFIKKILIDGIGALAWMFCLGLALSSFPNRGIVAAIVIFSIGNAVVLFIRPKYRLP